MEDKLQAEESLNEKLGRLAFAWCKVATPSLLLGRLALPVAAFLSSGLFIWAYIQGKKDTKCYLKYPLLAAGFWLVILALWLWAEFGKASFPWWLGWVHR